MLICAIYKPLLIQKYNKSSFNFSGYIFVIIILYLFNGRKYTETRKQK